jgi:hypothetical protein
MSGNDICYGRNIMPKTTVKNVNYIYNDSHNSSVSSNYNTDDNGKVT